MNYKTYEVMIWNDGTKAWFLNGHHHREDGPAYEGANGYKSWYINGQRHREDGPAVECPDGHKEWWLNGVRLSEQEWLARTSQQSCKGKVVEIDGEKYKLVKIGE